jgi:hypothetical protein
MQSVAPVLMGEVPSCMRFSCPPGVTQLSQKALKVGSESRQGGLREPRHYRTQDE